MSWFICEPNQDILRQPNSIIVWSFDHRVCFLRSDLPFSCKSDSKKEKSVVSFTHEQNIIYSQTELDDIAHEQAIICKQLFAGHLVGSRSMKRKKIAPNDDANYQFLYHINPMNSPFKGNGCNHVLVLCLARLKAFPSLPGGHFFISPLVFLFYYMISFMV